ncbi:host-nuclease inhibitor Gam family protein [Longitalea luteola]|uniref:host-nuclease inhibitor Gam family protein n=1 Tax=Longitalea luteola TaxID=2812563 RepID=UPI001A97830E|nr:host-nuclease inhibitor Gam family protein [Longitalea luteola]
MFREKKKVIINVNYDQAQEASARYAEISARLGIIEAQMNERINSIRDQFQDEIIQLTREKERQMDVLEIYAKEQKDNWGRRKSLDLLHSVIGFRTGTPKVTKDRKFSWDDVLDMVKEKFPSLVRVKCELDKEAIIAMREEEQFRDLVKTCFIDVVQDETFFVEPKLQTLLRVA